ncbi:hypothetical protein BH10PAT3_BH10PAT3_1620 [soil metagenome]
MDDIAIKVDHVYKDFKLPHERAGSLKNVFTHALSYVRKNRIYDTQHALKDISFEVKKGEFFGIVGRNGSGKSTLLKMLAGIYQPNKGNITVDGRLVPFIELGVGFNGELTGRENVYLNGALLGFTKKQVDDRYADIVEFAELEQFMDQKLKNYSSGMQVRLAFSLAIRAETDILLVDEVLAVGDADFQRKCFDYFRTLKRNKKTVIFVTHDMNAVREYCDRAIMIEKSEMVAEGNPEAVATKYTKMFMQKNTKDTETEASNRWGDESMKYQQVTVAPKQLRDEKFITITARAVATVAVEGPIFGFAIKNATGQPIMGTNTKIKHNNIASVEPGETVELTWNIPHVFGDGRYTVDVAVQKDGGTTECDWWESATSFRVYKDEPTPYVITPDISVRINR